MLDTCVRRDVTALCFSAEFMMWAIVETFKSRDDLCEMEFLCNGWEL